MLAFFSWLACRMKGVRGMAIATRSWACIVGTVLLVGMLLAGRADASSAGHTQSISRHVGKWTITVNLLPAQSFTHVVKRSTRGEMYLRGGRGHPLPASRANHQLVVFLQHDGYPATHANVRLWYQLEKRRHAGWHKVPVVRMEVAGKGTKTMHYGNNVLLTPGMYDVSVSVNSRPRQYFWLDVN